MGLNASQFRTPNAILAAEIANDTASALVTLLTLPWTCLAHALLKVLRYFHDPLEEFRKAAAANNLRTVINPKTIKSAQRWMEGMLHAHECQQRENKQPEGEQILCLFPYCSNYKKVVKHMAQCRLGQQCPEPNCVFIRKMIAHNKQCRSRDCSACLLVRQTDARKKNRVVPESKAWQKRVTQAHRNALLYTLVRAANPARDPIVLHDKRMHNQVESARKVEGDIYKLANTRSEYYNLLSEKVNKIRKEVEKKQKVLK